MKAVKMLRRHASRTLQSAGFSLLRTTSEYRAFTDVFVPPYSTSVDWQSGLGDAVFTLYGLVRAQHPEVIVEIGSARGRSTCALALACKKNGDGRVYAIDPHTVNPWTEIGTDGSTEAFLRARLRDYGLEPWCEVIVATSAEAAKGWTRRIDLLFIDGDHSFEGVRADFEMFQPWLAPNALVVFHDTAWNYYTYSDKEPQPGDFKEKLATMGVPKYMEILKYEGYRSVTLPLPPGLTILDPKPGGFVFCPPARANGS
jgi:predicted O-methyltransferase YrrM